MIAFGYTLVCIGLLMIGVIGLHKKGLGTKVFVSLIDIRQIENMPKATIDSLEVDMNYNHIEIIYMIPNFLVSFEIFYRYIKLVINFKGYNMIPNVANLLITKMFTEQSTNNSWVKYILTPKKLKSFLENQGLKGIEGKHYVSEILKGSEWSINPIEIASASRLSN